MTGQCYFCAKGECYECHSTTCTCCGVKNAQHQANVDELVFAIRAALGGRPRVGKFKSTLDS
jgi:hypothetical protein